jgi:hypothetical protein
MRYLGIDLAWGEGTENKPANRSGVVALEPDGTIVDAGWTIGIDQTLLWIDQQSHDDALLFVDAPLVIDNATGQRDVEREVGQRYGRWWVSANSTNLDSPRQAGVHLRGRLEQAGWRYDDGRDGPPRSGRVVSECYPYTTIVGVEELGYDDKRPPYKRPKKGLPAAKAWPIRTCACDDLIQRLARLCDHEVPVDLRSHEETRGLLESPSPAQASALNSARISSMPSSALGPQRSGIRRAQTAARSSASPAARESSTRWQRSSHQQGKSSANARPTESNTADRAEGRHGCVRLEPRRVGRVGLEPTTLGLKVPCSTS